MKPKIFLHHDLLVNSINQEISYFLKNRFTFLTKFWMLQVRNPCSCGISALFFQCCFMSEIQVLMTVFDFSGVNSRNHFLEGGFTFQWEGVVFQLGGASFLSGGASWWGISFVGEVLEKKIVGWRETLGEANHKVSKFRY